MGSRSMVVAPLVAVAVLGCPDTGIVCREGTNRCGAGCADYSSDRRNCGGCGQACAVGQVCVAAQCVCQAGTTPCEGRCAVLSSDPEACGACGRSCADGLVCERGECKVACTAGLSIRCQDSCVDPSTDPANCGGCGNACQAGQRCVAGGCTSDLVVACFSSGQVAGLSASTLQRTPLASLGSGPAALASMQGVLLAADGLDRRLTQADVPPGELWRQLPARAIATGAVPNQLLVAQDLVYVVNAESGTLQVVRRGPPDGDAGLPLSTIQELVLGPNTFPQGLVKLGTSLWIPLYGGFGGAASDAGQRLVEVDVSTPTSPRVVSDVSLAGLDLRPFDGGSAAPRPWAITSRAGALYVALNNLDPDTYQPAGPGLLARVDPSTRAVQAIDLGADACLNPQWVARFGDGLAVSCGGRAAYTGPNFVLTAVERAGVVVLDAQDRRVATWSPTPPTCPDAGACPLFLPGRFGVKDARLFLADQNAGRLTVLELSDAGLVERRGPARNDALAVCPPNPTSGVANVSDVYVP
ncbi:MAG: hypothetical protein INH41_12575 [Myxococcaceae bacterium]|nr:hypothetical protein [Myxococcaceae bacterium]MCA3013221.1 hypothetical protein [Myxococcaceae bacterium]